MRSLMDDPRLKRLHFEVQAALAVDADLDRALYWMECYVALLRDKRRIAAEELADAVRIPDDLSEL